jgi:hypothetical protein
MNDLQWIIDIEPMAVTYENIKGKAIYFDPPITKTDYLISVMDKLETIGFEVPKMVVTEDGGIIGLYSDVISNQIHYTTFNLYNNEKYQEHINHFAKREVEVLNGREMSLEL